LTDEYWEQAGREAQLRAFLRRARIAAPPQELTEIAPMLREFLLPPCEAVLRSIRVAKHWPAGGPWRDEK